MTQKLQRPMTLFFVSLIAFSLFTTLYTSKTASAQSVPEIAISKTTRTEVLNHQLYWFAKRCFALRDIGSMPVDKVRSYDWFNKYEVYNEGVAQKYDSNENFSQEELLIYGFLSGGVLAGAGAVINLVSDDKKYFIGSTRGGMYENPIVHCDGNWIEEAFSQLGYTDGLEAFCSLNFTYNTSTGGNEPGEGKGKGKQGCLDGQGGTGEYNAKANYDDQLKGFEELLKNNAVAKKAEGTLANQGQYYRDFTTLMRGCHISLDRVITQTQLSSGDNPAGGNDELFDVPVINAKGQVVHWLGTSGEGYNDGVKIPLVATLTSNGYKTKTCGQLAVDARKNAGTYATVVQNNPDDVELASADFSTGAGNSTRPDSCEANNNGALAWMGCAILEVMDGIVGFLDGQIRQLLTIKTAELNSGGGLQKSWAVMRNIAYLVLIPMMLLMVIGTALEFGPFDAYTVKKALPRMLMAVVFMSISYYLCIFFIEMSNVIGSGILNLVARNAPGGAVNSLTDVLDKGEGGLFTGLAGGGALVGLAVGAITWGILGSFALVTIVALLIGYVTLVLRQVLIIMLVVLSPLAILVWIFPGNDKLWTIWRTTFIAMLMMFPLIMLLIASGRFFAGTANELYGGVTGVFIKLIAYIAPFFFIPAAFKAGMGAFGVITGAINDRSRGLFDRQKKMRSGIRAREWQKAKAGERFNNRGLNALTSRATTSRFGFTGKGREAYQQKINNAGAAFAKSEQAQGVQHNDGALRAMTYGSEAQARANMARDFNMNDAEIDTSIAATKAAGGFGRDRQVWAAQQLAATGTGYDDLRQVSQTIARAANGNTSQAAALAGNINSATKSVGRYDLAPSFGQLNGLAQAEMGGGATDAAYHEATVRAARGADPVTLLRGKPQQVMQLTQALADHADLHSRRMNDTTLSAPDREASQNEYLDSVGQMEQLSQAQGYASPEAQAHISTMLTDTQQLRAGTLDTVLGRTYDTGGARTDMVQTGIDPTTGRGIFAPGPGISQAQADARTRYDQARAPRPNPNDPDY